MAEIPGRSGAHWSAAQTMGMTTQRDQGWVAVVPTLCPPHCPHSHLLGCGVRYWAHGGKENLVPGLERLSVPIMAGRWDQGEHM